MGEEAGGRGGGRGGGQGGRGEDLKTRTPHNDVGNKSKRKQSDSKIIRAPKSLFREYL